MAEQHKIKELPEPVECPEVERAQRFTTSAFDCVQNVLGLVSGGKGVSNQDSDLYRAAIVFAGAGLDSALKQLIRDSLPRIIETNGDASAKFEHFLERYLKDSKGDLRVKHLARVLAAENSRDHLVEAYQRELTSESLPSVEQLQLVAGAFGISDSEVRKSLRGLKPAFDARNQIVHELDLKHTENRGDRSRHYRSKKDVESAHALLRATQALINSVADQLCGDKKK